MSSDDTILFTHFELRSPECTSLLMSTIGCLAVFNNEDPEFIPTHAKVQGKLGRLKKFFLISK
jgi:hypothetical protein